jgi:hypothetical protein
MALLNSGMKEMGLGVRKISVLHKWKTIPEFSNALISIKCSCLVLEHSDGFTNMITADKLGLTPGTHH